MQAPAAQMAAIRAAQESIAAEQKAIRISLAGLQQDVDLLKAKFREIEGTPLTKAQIVAVMRELKML